MKKKTLIFLLLITCLILAGAGFYLLRHQNKPQTQQSLNQQLTLVKTNPDPLDNTTILPTQNLEFTFNMPIYRSEFKHHFDPDVPHDIEVVSGIDSEHGNTIRIKFRQPLQLGSGYTLFIEAGTKVDQNHKLDRDFIYHFTTINYRGV